MLRTNLRGMTGLTAQAIFKQESMEQISYDAIQENGPPREAFEPIT